MMVTEVMCDCMNFLRCCEGTEEGVGILSRYPVLETTAYKFKHYGGDKDGVNRTCLRALIDTPHGRVNFFVVHLSFVKEQQVRYC
jgi:endonuclease/exonuclease/phosphatase family metal-dependent hydrolase